MLKNDLIADEETPAPRPVSPEVVEDMDAERAFEKLRKAAHVRPWDHGKDGLQKPCMFIFCSTTIKTCCKMFDCFF